ncbi:MAG: MinD/ParA family protein [Oscillospiraceae bacterium]|nr:MinD/ParA family protein [Oscillospiraceae bacterium]
MADQAQNLRELVGKSNDIRVISVASGKGGVGKSTISVNLAVAMSRLGMRVLIVDADFGLANVDVMLGVATKYDVSHFLRGERALHEIIQYGYEGVRFISGGSGVNDLLNIDEAQLGGLIEGLVQIETAVDVIIIDTGAGINDNIVKLVLASSETLVVTTPEPTSILDAYALVKTIVKSNRSHQIHILMNKCESKKEALRVQDGFIEVVGRHLGKNISPMGQIMYDQSIPQSIKRQIPISVSAPLSETSREIERIAKSILEIPSENASSGLLSRVFNKIMGEKREQLTK